MKSPIVFAVAKATSVALSHLKLTQFEMQPRAVDPDWQERMRAFAERQSTQPRNGRQLGM